jgi:hypothetical protein
LARQLKGGGYLVWPRSLAARCQALGAHSLKLATALLGTGHDVTTPEILTDL